MKEPYESCRRCELPSTHPMARIDGSGSCALCRRQSPDAARDRLRGRERARMEELFARVRKREGVRVLLALSGGKDSCWTMLQLRERYGLTLRALTLDNGFLSETALENARELCAKLGVEHVVVRPPVERLRRLFAEALHARLFPPTALTRASSVCNACIAVVKSACLREALSQRMDVLVWGWSPGQASLASAVFRPSRKLVARMSDGWRGPLAAALGVVGEELGLDLSREYPDVRMPYFVSPLAMLATSESSMIDDLQALGWKAPSDVDVHSTNCRLNALASHEHCTRYGFHPYALETAGLVREGLLDPARARERMRPQVDSGQLAAVAEELDLDDALRRELGLLLKNATVSHNTAVAGPSGRRAP